ncbi:hypothetical protein [Coprococcus eutactus]|uniref:hypothetical protein n=1 Tax=Coprococcus eutactus TaxID=33043 RepID=UPI001C02641B|nr:hypothetical protein [Coprococcus eutactus]
MLLTISTTKLFFAEISLGDYNFHRWTSKPTEYYSVNSKPTCKPPELHTIMKKCNGMDTLEKIISRYIIKAIILLDEKMIPNPEMDFVTICSNCHRMIHRKKNDIITPEQLKKIIQEQNSNNVKPTQLMYKFDIE